MRERCEANGRPWFHGLLALLLLAIGFVSSCGSGFVKYRGTVSVTPEGASTYSFDEAPNPDAREALPGARVSLCLGDCREQIHKGAKTDVADEDGSWGPLEIVHGSSPFSSRRVTIRCELEGYEPLIYFITVSETDEPTGGQKYMNIQLAPADMTEVDPQSS